MNAGPARAWPLPLQSALAAMVAFCALALLCEALAPALPANAPTRSADTGAMALMAPLVAAIELLALLVVALPAAAVGALLGRLAAIGWRGPTLIALALPCGLLLGAVYTRVAAPPSALTSTAAAMGCALGATAAALVAITLRLPPAGHRR